MHRLLFFCPLAENDDDDEGAYLGRPSLTGTARGWRRGLGHLSGASRTCWRRPRGRERARRRPGQTGTDEAATTATRGRCGARPGAALDGGSMEIPGHVGECVYDVGDAALCPTRAETPSADGAGSRFFFVPFRKEASRRRQLQGLLGTMEGSVKTKRDRGWRWREKGGGRTSGASSTSPATRTVTTAEELSPASSGPRRCRSAPGELGGSERCGVGHCERGE
jgi:hypothetical protein